MTPTAYRYKIVVAYDGTGYFGWQYLPDQSTVAGALQNTFAQVFSRTISIFGASRTDAGVHACGQVASFTTDLDIEEASMLEAWNNLLPTAISVRSIEKVALSYNPHHDVVEKTYQYHFFLERPLPIHARYGWYFRYPVDLAKLQQSLQVFVGTHDFRSFCTGDDRENTVRTITYAAVEPLPEWNGYRITIKGPGFLRHMIRRIVGACLDVASRDRLAISHLKDALDEKDPEQLLPNAPPHGLMLYKIEYTE